MRHGACGTPEIVFLNSFCFVVIFRELYKNTAVVYKRAARVCYLHTVVSESRAGVIKLMRFFVLECKWDSHLAFAIGTVETPGVITALNYAQGQSVICIRGAFIWLMSGRSRHHPAWNVALAAPGGRRRGRRMRDALFVWHLCVTLLPSSCEWQSMDPLRPPPPFSPERGVLTCWWGETHWISINAACFSMLCFVYCTFVDSYFVRERRRNRNIASRISIIHNPRVFPNGPFSSDTTSNFICSYA